MPEKTPREWSTPYVAEITDPDEIAAVRSRHSDPDDIDELINGSLSTSAADRYAPADLGLWARQSTQIEEVTADATMRGRAVALARLGLKVFKLDPISHTPIAPRFWEQASNDPDRVAQMWTGIDAHSSEDHAIAVLTGDGVVALDIDVKGGKPGNASLFVLEQCDGLDTDTLTASTPSGGRHLFYRVPGNAWWMNRQGKRGFRPGIDLKGSHGYVVGVGSERSNGTKYTWLNNQPILPLPKWIEDEIRRPIEPENDHATFQLAIRTPDDEWAYNATAAYLATAPEAIDHSGTGHSTIIEVANRCMDFGLTPDGAVDAMMEHWVPRCSLDADTVESLPYQIHALKGSRRQPIGVSHPEGRTKPWDAFKRVQLARRDDEGPKLGLPIGPRVPREIRELRHRHIPPRRWIFNNFLVRGFVTGIVSPGGTGKTSFLAATALAIAARDGAYGDTIKERTRVWYWNQEDDEDELDRRFKALTIHFDIDDSRLLDEQGRSNLYVNSGVDWPLFVARRDKEGRLVEDAEITHIIKLIREREIGVFIMDPLVEFHEGSENDNPEMRFVWSVARKIAVLGDCAVLVAAHPRKPPQAASDGFVGDQDAFRGASAQTGVMRLGFTMFGMSSKDAKRFGVHEDERHLYVRVDPAKANLMLKTAEPQWLKRISVDIGGEQIGVLEPVVLEKRVSRKIDLLDVIARSMEVAGLDGVPLKDLVAAMSPADLEELGTDTNRGRRIKKAITEELGHNPEKGETAEIETDHGRLSITNYEAPKGFYFALRKHTKSDAK
jgi:hypothetical protein